MKPSDKLRALPGDAADEVRCRHCAVVLVVAALGTHGPGRSNSTQVLQHETDVCIRNLLMRLVANDDRRMKFSG